MFKSNLSEKQKGLLKITEDKTIKDALLRINQNLQKCLIVVDKKSKLKGGQSKKAVEIFTFGTS